MPNLKCDNNNLLKDHAMTLIDKAYASLEVAAFSLNIPQSWLRSVSNGTIQSPSVSRIEAIIKELDPELYVSIKNKAS